MIGWISFALIIPLSLWRGYVLAVLWSWHVSPVFGIVEISAAQGWGISALMTLLTYQLSGIEADGKDRQLIALVLSIAFPALCLFSGWLATLFL